MPLVDKPLPELYDYLGRNPRPEDFNAYWAAALRELDATDPRSELRPNPLLNVGGARVYAKYLRPKNQPPGLRHPAVLQFHGYSGHSGDWLDKFGWPAEGFCYAAMDCRGQGG